ncbi:peptidase family M48 domain containing protein [Lactarius tabidus]
MFATRTCRALPFLAARSSRCRPSLLHHLESRVQTCSPPRRIVSLLPHRNLSASAASRAQYSRFDDHPNQDPNHQSSPLAGLQRRDVIIYTIGIGSVIYYLFHLEQVPETGRWRFMDVSPKFEAALWETSFDELSKEYRAKLLPPSHVITQHVHRVVSRILEANNLGTLCGDGRVSAPPRGVLQSALGFGNSGSEEAVPDLWDPDSTGGGTANGFGKKEWNLLVVNDNKVVNAMAAPGTVVVFTGILPVAKDEQGLAAILGHEIGHVVARHTAERYSYSKIFIAMGWLADIVGLPTGIGGLATTLLMDLPHSRTQEYEADKIGLNLSAKACFNPTAAPEMFKRLGALEKSSGGLNVSFLNTHPASEERVKQLETLLPEAFAVQASSACGGGSDYLGAFSEAIGLERTARTPWE